MDNLNLSKLLFKIKNCVKYEYLYFLEEDFNRVGLTLQNTISDNMVLCCIKEGKAKAESIMEDYIFVGTIKERKEEISPRMTESIVNFIMQNASDPAAIQVSERKWQNGVATYGQIVILGEDINKIAQNINIVD